MFSRLKTIFRGGEKEVAKQKEDSDDEPMERRLSIAQTSDWLNDLRRSQILVPHLSSNHDADLFVNQVYMMKPKETGVQQSMRASIDVEEEAKKDISFSFLSVRESYEQKMEKQKAQSYQEVEEQMSKNVESQNNSKSTSDGGERPSTSSSNGKSDALEFEDKFVKEHPLNRTEKLPSKKRRETQIVLVENDLAKIEGIEWAKLVKECKFDFRKKDKPLDSMIRQLVDTGLKMSEDHQTVYIKQHAYCLMLGISLQQIKQHFNPLYKGLLSISEQRQQQAIDKKRFNHQIKIDIQRTLSNVEVDAFNEPFESGRNTLYNLLSAYQEHDQNVRYMQGMNYLGALILISVRDEVIAFAIFERIMLGKHNYAQIYEDKLTKLIYNVKEIRKWMKSKHKKLLYHLEANDIYLETVLSSPFLALFTNLIDIDSALRVLDRFIYLGEQTIIDIIKQVFTIREQELLEMNDTFDLQRALTQHLYKQAIEEKTFFPSLQQPTTPSSRSLIGKLNFFA